MGRINWEKAIGTKVNGFLIKDYKRENKHSYVYVECPFCLQNKWMRTDWIREQRVVSCGCYNAENNYTKPKDIKGRVFGKLQAVEPTEQKDSNGCIIWECICECGNTTFVTASDLLYGGRVSCGCNASNAAKKRYEYTLKPYQDKDIVDGTSLHAITSKELLATNTSGCTGVTYDKERNKWLAQIIFRGKHYYLGRYDKKEDAIQARFIAENKLHGDFLEWYLKNYTKNKRDAENE